VNRAEAVASALGNLRAHKLRSSLTLLGIVFGVGAVIAMLAIGAGAERQALAMIERLGVRNLLVRAKELSREELAEVRKRSPGLAPRDAAALREAVPGTELVAARIALEAWSVRAGERKSDAPVYGVSPHHAELFGLRVAEGRFLDALDERHHAQVCVVGPEVRRELFGFDPAVGRDLKVNDVWLEVVGVLADAGGDASFEGVEIGSSRGVVYLPASTAQRKFDRDALASPYDELVVRLRPAGSSAEAAEAAGRLLAHLHAGADDYEVIVPESLLRHSRRTQRLFTLVMASIAGISLLVGGIGIMNIMLASVLERTREIGVRRAVGATQKSIRDQFLAEAFTLSAAGGLAGIAWGVAVARLVAASAGWPTVVTGASILLAAGVAIAVGLASGLYPAVQAARLDPIDALRHE
jgi:putative ABC transport system permease protein